MKIMRRFILLGVLLLSCGLVMLFNNPLNSTAQAASGGLGPRSLPAIVATSIYDGAESVHGTLKVTGMELALDGITIYPNTNAIESKDLILNITPDEFYQVVDIVILRGTFDGTVFNSNAVESESIFDSQNPNIANFHLDTVMQPQEPYGECDNGPDCDDLDCTVHNLPEIEVLDYMDYKIEVHFALIQYDIEVTYEYFDAPGVNEPTLSTLFTSSNQVVSLNSAITLENLLETNLGKRFAYAEMPYNYGDGSRNLELETGMTYTGTYQLIFDANLLRSHVKDGKIKIVAVYVKTFEVTVTATPSSSSHIDSIQVHTESPVIYQQGNFYKIYNGPITQYLDLGTEVTVYSQDNEYFTLNDQATKTFTVDSNNYVTVNFIPKKLTLTILGFDSNGNVIDEFVGDALVKDSSNTIIMEGIHIFNKLHEIAYNETDIPEYIFESYSIKRVTRGANGEKYDTLTLDSPRTIDESFLQQYLIDGEITIVANFTKQCILNITLLDDKGSAEVYLLDTLNSPIKQVTPSADNLYYFDMGAKIQIKAVSSLENVFYLKNITGISTSSISGDTAIITMNSHVSLTVIFESKTFNLTALKENENTSYDDTLSYGVGQTISFTYGVPASHTIKNWKLNGKSYTSYGDDVYLSGNTLTVKLTTDLLSQNPTWLQTSGDVVNLYLDHDVQTAMKTELLLGILLPAVLIPAAAIAFGIIMFINARRNKLIKATLTEKRTEKMKYNVGDYVSDLREGKSVGEITKEDIKSEIKKRKDDK